MSDSSETTVVRNDERRRYEVLVDGDVAGFLLIRPREDGRVVLPHTEIDPAYEGRGLGSVLASQSLADLAGRGDVVVPVCPFLTRYLQGHEIAGLEIEWPDEDDADGAVAGEPA